MISSLWMIHNVQGPNLPVMCRAIILLRRISGWFALWRVQATLHLIWRQVLSSGWIWSLCAYNMYIGSSLGDTAQIHTRSEINLRSGGQPESIPEKFQTHTRKFKSGSDLVVGLDRFCCLACICSSISLMVLPTRVGMHYFMFIKQI